MKRTLLLFLFMTFTAHLCAQEGLRAGVNIGLPLGDAAHVSSFSIDMHYHWEVDEAISAGIATGFTNAFDKSMDTGFGTLEFEDVQFLSIAASSRFIPSEDFNVGLDLGHALGITDGIDGGFYY